ncbi:MAG: SphA family protein [Methyloceanibacter sp.]
MTAPNAHAAEFGTGPWLKGYTDVFSGLVPPVPGLYIRTDFYNYHGNADTVIFNGRIGLDVEQEMRATLLGMSYVTPWKILGGTYAVAALPTMVAMDVDVGLSVPSFTGPRGRTFGPFEINRGDTNLAIGDTAFSPIILGWHSGKFNWSTSLFFLAPTGDYSTRQLANTSLNHWAVMPQIAATYFDPATGWQASGMAVYSINWENPATDYRTGEILNLEGSLTKNFGAFGVGAVGYAMIQTTGDSGAGATLGDFKSRVFGAGPILTYTMGAGTATPLTFIAKYYKEFDAKNTFEGEVWDLAFSFKF